MADVDLVADRAIMAFVRDSRRDRGLRRVGQFLLMFTAASKHRHLNYAIPDDDAEPSAAEVDALVDAFRVADRMPRLEFLPTVAPALEARLLDHGFTVEERLPHRRRGLGAAMVPALVRQCFDAGLPTVFLEAAPGADGAYRHAGFVRTSTSLHMSLEGERDV